MGCGREPVCRTDTGAGSTASTLSFYFASFEKLFGWSHAQVSLLATSFSLAMGLSAPLVGWLLDRSVPLLFSALALVGLFAGSAPIAAPVLLVETLGLRRFASLFG